MSFRNTRRNATDDHVPLDFTVDIDDACSILYPHEESGEARPNGHSPKRPGLFERIKPWPLLRSVSQESQVAASSNWHKPYWPLGLERHLSHVKHREPAKKLVDSMMRSLTLCPPGEGQGIEDNLCLVKISENASFATFVNDDLEDAIQPKASEFLQIWYVLSSVVVIHPSPIRFLDL